MPVTGWKLDPAERSQLLLRFPPEWPDVVADHITLDAAASMKDPLPEARSAQIVGSVSDGKGVQAMVVSIDGTTRRPDGSTYHITWSLDRARDRRAVESNEVIARLGWEALAEPVAIRIAPARF